MLRVSLLAVGKFGKQLQRMLGRVYLMLSRIILKDLQILRCIDLNRNQPSLKDRDLCKFTARNLGVTEEKTFLGEYIIASAQKLTSTAAPCFAEELTQAQKGELQAHSSSNESMPKKQNVDCHVAEDKSAEAKPKATKGKSKTSMRAASKKKLSGKGPSTQALELCLSHSAARGNRQQIHPHVRERKAGLVVQLIACPLDG